MSDYDNIKKVQEENSFLLAQNEAYLKMLNQYELFNFYTSRIFSLKNNEDVCSVIVEAVKVFFVKKNERNSAAVFLTSEESFDFVCKAWQEDKDVFEKEFFQQADSGVIAWIINNKKSIIVTPLNNSEYISCMLVPMCSGESVIGITMVYFNMAITNFERENLKIIDLLCMQAGIFIENLIFSRKKIEQNKKLELANQILQREQKRADIANKAKSDFLANMSHEIRTPMTCIMGYAEMLQENPNHSEQEAKYISSIYTSSRVLMALINDILDISKIEAGAILLENIPFNMKYLVNSVMDIFQHKAEQKKLKFICELADNIPYSVKGDPTRIRQIFLNIIGNAIKFTESGSVTIRGGVADISDDKVYFAFSVEDTGIGISDDKKDEIFESFTQVEASITRKYGGTGLGLSITKSLIKILGGDIAVESVLGKGSSFSFTFMLDMSEEYLNEDYAVRYMMHDDLKGKRVSIIDANMSLCETLKEWCVSVGMNVVGMFSCAEEAFAFLKQEKADIPHIILTDAHIIEEGKDDIASFCKENFEEKNIKLISLSTYAFPGAARKAKDLGFDAYLAKPINKNDLINVMCMVLGNMEVKEKYIVTRHMSNELLDDKDKKSTKKRKVLLAEDNEAIQEYIKEFLYMHDCEVEIVSDGEEAVAYVENNSCDMVLMDINMPTLDGISATKIIREKISKDLPIIALTAAATGEAKDMGMSAGMNDFVTKPVSHDKLKELVKKWVPLDES